MIIMGVDPGLANTGWGIVETKGSICRARAYDCIVTSSHDSLADRLGKIFFELKQAIERFGPSQVAIEKLFFGDNARSAILVAQARGAAIAACAQAGLEVDEYTPAQIKQSVVGTGSADKYQIIYMVRNVLALDHDPRPDHCADALAAAVCHANLARTQALTRDHAAVQMLEQERAQREADADAARDLTAAASAAHRGRSARELNALSNIRPSRRSTL